MSSKTSETSKISTNSLTLKSPNTLQRPHRFQNFKDVDIWLWGKNLLELSNT